MVGDPIAGSLRLESAVKRVASQHAEHESDRRDHAKKDDRHDDVGYDEADRPGDKDESNIERAVGLRCDQRKQTGQSRQSTEDAAYRGSGRTAPLGRAAHAV